MPIVKVSTNFSVNQLPKNFMQNFGQELANILGKPPGRISWKLETDQAMSLLVIHVLILLALTVYYGQFCVAYKPLRYVPTLRKYFLGIFQ